MAPHSDKPPPEKPAAPHASEVRANDLEALYEIVARGANVYALTSSWVKKVRLWNELVVVGRSYARGPKVEAPDARTPYDLFYHRQPIEVLVDRLLETGEAFVTYAGDATGFVRLEWTISAVK